MFLANAASKLAPAVEAQADKWLDTGINTLRTKVPQFPTSTQSIAAVVVGV